MLFVDDDIVVDVVDAAAISIVNLSIFVFLNMFVCLYVACNKLLINLLTAGNK